MARNKWFSDFLENLFKGKSKINGNNGETLVIEVPAAIYYKELAVYTASSLIGNAISKSEVKTFRNFKPVREEDYFLLNCSPNRNETSSYFWHKVINKMIREGSALVVETSDGYLYCADSWVVKEERPILGDTYSNVTVGSLTFQKSFTQAEACLFRLDDLSAKQYIDGMYDDFGDVLSSAAAALRKSNGQKYKLHIDAVKAGDEEFNEEFTNHISKQIREYLKSDSGVYPEFDGYTLEADPNRVSRSSADYLALMQELMTTAASAFHIPESMMTGNITSMKEVIGAFLTFGVDPYADAISEGLNKRAGIQNFKAGNYYKVDTAKIQHQNLFDLSAACSNLISSGLFSIDDILLELGYEPLNTEWSSKHFITKNFEEIERFLTSFEEGGE